MRLTRQEAIEQNCYDCNYDSADVGTNREQVERCTTVKCPFYEYRPVTTKTEKARLEAKIANMSEEELAKFRIKQDRARNQLKK